MRPAVPVFDFECQSCGQTHEELILGEPAEPRCPACGSSELRKLLGTPSPPGRSKGMIAAARRLAAAEGNLSNFSASERARIPE